MTDEARTEVREWIPAELVALGGLFVALPFVHRLVFYGAPVKVTLGSLVNLAFMTGCGLAVATGGYLLARSDLDPARYRRVAGWCVGGMAVNLGLNLVLIAVFPADTLAYNAGWALFAVALGAVVGLLVGLMEARAIHRELRAERAALRADVAETRREWLDYLNSLLRHEVLNNANVIEGYATLLIEENDLDEVTRDRLETIRRQSRDMTDVTEDVRLLIEATHDAHELEAVDLEAVLTAELRDLRAGRENVEVETDIPSGVTVRGDALLPRVFSNLLTNAVEHNDSDPPRVRVSVETTPETVTVRVADNGPGVPPEERDDLFERGSYADHGLGLALVRTLVRRYEGEVELAETGPDGSVFAVTLPRAAGSAESGTVAGAPVDRPTPVTAADETA